jgi:hypothetical protein
MGTFDHYGHERIFGAEVVVDRSDVHAGRSRDLAQRAQASDSISR